MFLYYTVLIQKMKVVITIPAYNEEKNIGQVIQEIKNCVDSKKYDYKIQVIDDGSTDRTADIAKGTGAIVYKHPKNYGLAEAFKTEIKNAIKNGAEIIVHTDADGQYPAEQIPELIKKVEEGYDLVLGSRFKKGKYSGPIMNKLGNIAFAKVFSKILRTEITDTTTGFRAFNVSVAKFPLINTFTYTQEQIIRAVKEKKKFVEIPIRTNQTRKSRLFRNPLDYAIKAWINILRLYRDYQPLKFFGVIGSWIFSVGFIIGLYLIYLHFTEGIKGHIALMMLDVIILSVGLQLIIFGFIADMKKDL